MIKLLNLKLVILLEYQNMKIFLQKVTLQIGLNVFVFKKVKNTVPWTYDINDLNVEEICWNFLRERIAKKQIKKSLELKK